MIHSDASQTSHGPRSTFTGNHKCVFSFTLVFVFRSMMIMMVLCPKAGSLAFMPLGNETSEVACHCLSHRQLWVSNLSKVATWWPELEGPMVTRHRTYHRVIPAQLNKCLPLDHLRIGLNFN